MKMDHNENTMLEIWKYLYSKEDYFEVLEWWIQIKYSQTPSSL